jgi:hypothetical protein
MHPQQTMELAQIAHHEARISMPGGRRWNEALYASTCSASAGDHAGIRPLAPSIRSDRAVGSRVLTRAAVSL